MSLKEFSAMGSCCSRIIFNSDFTPGYKKFMHINFSVEGGSLISLMSKPVDFDRELLTAEKPFDNTCVENDFSKKYLDFLKTANLEYILMDTYFDLANLLLLDNGSYVSNTARLRRTELYNTLEITKKINVLDNVDEFISLWKNACDSFFDFLNEYCEDTKVILNCARLAYRYEESNGNIVIHEPFLKRALKQNHIRDLLETYLLENYDVDVLSFDRNTLLDKNHEFGFDPSHYTSDYYPTKLSQLVEIIQRNEFFDSYNNEINSKIRKLKRDKEILKFQNWDLSEYTHKDNIIERSFCPICGKISVFEPFGEHLRENAKCPNCGSLERHRLTYLLLQNNYKELINGKEVKLLHLVPDTVFYKYFSNLSNIDYFPVDSDIRGYESKDMGLTKETDLENFPWENDTFDIIYNSHVLQNVPNDIGVMKELYRVLKPDGICITAVPYSNEPNTIEEDINSLDLNHGGKAPFRKYGLDFKDRLISCGFDVIELENTDIVKSSFDFNSYKLESSGSIFICTK